MTNMETLTSLQNNLEQIIIGKSDVLRLAVTCLVAGGHLLIEDIPGTGKTTLAIGIARSIRASFARIQFTADLLPSDITGVSVYNREKNKFEFQAGPIFNNIVLADEINRGTPRVQSGLLEAMNEHQVSMDGRTYPLPSPFFVVATQNPLTFAGTYPLLSAQLDRFLLKIQLGYITPDQEIEMLKRQSATQPLGKLQAVMSLEEIVAMQQKSREVTVDDAIFRYIVSLVQATRKSPEIQYGISHRGTLALFNAVRAYATVCGRNYTVPDDVKNLALPVLAHRLIQASNRRSAEFAENFLKNLLRDLPVPL